MSLQSVVYETLREGECRNDELVNSMMRRNWIVKGQPWSFVDHPQLMGIVNVTPDSFSDGGSFLAVERAVAHAVQLAGEGAAILDIGGESTRPGAEPVPVDEELRRVVPVIRELARSVKTPISIDTTKASVARAALEAGAAIVNDISGLTFEREMQAVCRDFDAGIIAMHMQGTPQTMQQAPCYNNVVAEINDYFGQLIDRLGSVGIDPSRIVLDPGVGFGKTPEHNLQILSSISWFQQWNRPVMIGHSRKRFLQKLLGRNVDERLHGSTGISIALASQGVELLRVHDIAAHRDALVAWRAIVGRIVVQ